MGALRIVYPVKERDIQPLCRRFHNLFKSKLDFVRVSKALQQAKYARYPRTKRAKYGSLQRGFSLQEFKEFLSLMTPEEHRFRFYCLWSVWWGERQGEAFKFNLNDINLENQTVKIFREKNEGPQEFRVSDALWAELLSYISTYETRIREKNGFIFFSASRTQNNRARKHWSSGWIRRKFREVCSRQKAFDSSYSKTDCWHPKAKPRALHQFTPHSLRYTFAYIAIDFFKDITIVKELMGHKRGQSTQQYVENYRKAHVKEFSVAMQEQSCMKQLL